MSKIKSLEIAGKNFAVGIGTVSSIHWDDDDLFSIWVREPNPNSEERRWFTISSKDYAIEFSLEMEDEDQEK